MEVSGECRYKCLVQVVGLVDSNVRELVRTKSNDDTLSRETGGFIG